MDILGVFSDMRWGIAGCRRIESRVGGVIRVRTYRSVERPNSGKQGDDHRLCPRQRQWDGDRDLPRRRIRWIGYRRSNPQRKGVPKEHRPEQANNVYQWYVPAGADLPQFESNRGLVQNVVVRNMQVLSLPRRGSILNGYNSRHGITNVIFEGLEIDGKTIRSAEEANMYLNHVKDLQFRPRPDTK